MVGLVVMNGTEERTDWMLGCSVSEGRTVWDVAGKKLATKNARNRTRIA